ncbi:MAG: hypothetical protein WBE30_01230, partial [Candidatus Cybelea sp.]
SIPCRSACEKIIPQKAGQCSHTHGANELCRRAIPPTQQTQPRDGQSRALNQIYVADFGAAVVKVIAIPSGKCVATLNASNGLSLPAGASTAKISLRKNRG